MQPTGNLGDLSETQRAGLAEATPGRAAVTKAWATAPDGTQAVRVGRRRYLVQDTALGTRLYAAGGVPLAMTSERFASPKAAEQWVATWLAP